MKFARTLGGAMRAVVLAEAFARRCAGPSLLVGVMVIVTGCGGAVKAPVVSPTRPAIPGPEREYVVVEGDTLYSIAWRNGVDYRALAGVNSIRDPYTIFPGQRLLVPEPGEGVPSDPPEGVPSEPSEVAAAAQPPSRERDVAVGGAGVSGAVSISGTGTTVAPEVISLSPSLPDSDSSTKSAQPVAAAVESPPKARPDPSARTRRPSATPAESVPLATRTVAGLRWTRPTGGKTISTFGRSGNKGVDIEGVFEQPIRAAAPGRVVYAGSGLIGYGKLVIVKHSSRLLSAYAHNEKLRVGEGDEVEGGQHIADMGRSSKGRVMLHFEIRRDGRPVDPLRFIPRPGR